MPKKLLRRWTPDADSIRKHRHLSFLGRLLHDANLFHLNRHSVSVASFAGLFVCVLPVPGQTVLAALAAIILRCNLPLAMALTWVGNPVTLPVFWFIAYGWGARILGSEMSHISFDVSWEWLEHTLPLIWQPLLLGTFIMGLFLGCSGYLAVQGLWRWHVAKRWHLRRRRKKQ